MLDVLKVARWFYFLFRGPPEMSALTCGQWLTKQLWPERLELLISFMSLLVGFFGVVFLF